jgi:hypothetical protein
MTSTDSIILIAYDWNGHHDEGQITDPGTEGLVVTADGHVIAHPPYRADLLQVGLVTYEDEPEAQYYGPEVRC